MSKPSPDGYHSITPHMCLKNAAEAMRWYADALGAEETVRMPGPGD